jgi:hypothetical protein
MGVLFVAALISLWVLRKTEAKLLKNKDALEKQIVQQQRDLLSLREDANAWRGEMQHQFDHFRHMASDQLKVEEKRFDDLLQKSREREQHLQTSLDIAKQMCLELPGTKARLMQLESIVGLDAGDHLSTVLSPTAGDHHGFVLSQIPDLNGVKESPLSASEPEASSVLSASDSTKSHEGSPRIEAELLQLQQKNIQLQQALTAARLRSRIRERQSHPRGRNGRN